jgi:superfamily II DNA or RNA helicase
MKAVISNRIYLEVTQEYKEVLSKELTYSIPTYNPKDPPQVIKTMVRIRSDLVSIPVGRVDLIPDDYEIIDKRLILPEDFPDFKFPLRESQQAVFDEIEDNAIINAWVSWGKTFTGLAIAGKLGQKTLVVTHTVPLRNQWAKEVEKVYGFKPGIIGSGQFDLEPPIVIGNTQTLYRNIGEVQKKFGTVILDEMHHVSSPTFSKIIDSSYARYKIGLSGTVQRKDGKHVIMPDYFGHTKFTPPKENYMEPTIEVIQTRIRFMDGAKIPWANRINDLVRQEEYGKLICFLAAAYRKQGHKVLLLSDRVYFLKRVKETLGEHCELITGEVPLAEREKKIERVQSGKVDILLGTQSIFSEGISVNPLSCLILATPVSNTPLLTQLVGRVIREYPGKIDPVVVDINLKGKTAEKQAKLRLGHYLQQGYNVFFKDM